MQDKRIAFIGGGNLAASLIGGIIASGMNASQITAADPMDETRERLSSQFGINTSADNVAACSDADVVVLAVKPQIMKVACESIAATINERKPMVMSVAAGITVGSLQNWLSDGLSIVRTMPNTPALVGKAITAIYANPNTSAAQKQLAEQIMGAVGEVVSVSEESLLNPVTAVSGSGPAYFFLAIESLQAAAEARGLPKDVAAKLAIHTALGAAHLAAESDDDPATLRRKVTSPNGTTEAALNVMNEKGLKEIFAEAVKAADERAVELAAEMGA